jgi:hypothetical protein
MDFIMVCARFKSNAILGVDGPDLTMFLNHGPEFRKQGRGIVRTG